MENETDISEETQEEEAKEEEASDEADSTPTMIKDAERLAERLEKANAESLRILKKQEELIAEARLGGRSVAGRKEEPQKEVSPQEYAEQVLKGKIPK